MRPPVLPGLGFAILEAMVPGPGSSSEPNVVAMIPAEIIVCY